MKKYCMSILILIGIILVGCAENPALIGLEEEVPKSPEGNEDKPEIDESNKESKPPSVQIFTGDASTYVALDVWCWKEESLCSLEPSSPEEQLYGNQPLSISPGEVFEFAIATDGIPESNHIYHPDFIDLTQIRLGEEEKVEVEKNQITAPLEKGRYYYSMKLQWDGDIVGQAYYVFSISVQ